MSITFSMSESRHTFSAREGEGQPSLLSEKGGGEEAPLTSISEEEVSSLLRQRGGRRPTPSPLQNRAVTPSPTGRGKANRPFSARKEVETRGPSLLQGRKRNHTLSNTPLTLSLKERGDGQPFLQRERGLLSEKGGGDGVPLTSIREEEEEEEESFLLRKRGGRRRPTPSPLSFSESEEEGAPPLTPSLKESCHSSERGGMPITLYMKETSPFFSEREG